MITLIIRPDGNKVWVDIPEFKRTVPDIERANLCGKLAEIICINDQRLNLRLTDLKPCPSYKSDIGYKDHFLDFAAYNNIFFISYSNCAGLGHNLTYFDKRIFLNRLCEIHQVTDASITLKLIDDEGINI